MSEKSLGARVLSGARLYLIGQLAVTAINFFVTPKIVHGLGPDGYALYALMWTLASYLIVLQFGANVTIPRYVAFYQGREDSMRLTALLRWLLWRYIGASLIATVFLLASRNWIIIRFLHTQGPVLEVAPRVMLCVALAMPAFFTLQFGLFALYGMQRFATYNFFFALQSTCVGICAAGLLAFGKQLDTIAIAFVAIHLILAVGILWCLRGPLAGPETPLAPQEVSEIKSFSLKNFANMALWTLISQGDRIFIGSMLPLTQLGYYIVPTSLVQRFNIFSGAVTSTASPMITELHGRDDPEGLRRLYLKASELSLYFLLPLSIISFVLAPQFLTLWLGESFSQWGTWPMRWLLAANLVYCTTYLASSVTIAKGHPEIFTLAQVGKLSALILFWCLLISRHGIAGAAVGTLVAEILSAPIFMTYVHRRFLTIDWKTFIVRVILRPMLAGVALAALGLTVHSRIDTWPRLLIFASAGGALYLFVGYKLLEPEAKEFLWDWIKSKQ
jgi:O-antigen/teichoic acid export membrane protein